MQFIKQTLLTLAFLLLVTLTCVPSPGFAADNEMLDLDLQSLMQIQITSAGRKAQNLADVPAAVYVIDQEAIHNSGVTSVPEALRMVPGLQVARISSSKWAITSRGFSGTFSNKLLVQIDGRSVYTPTFSGVYWDVQNVMLEDVERIEVIRGPGATLWGANAVNGIINVITKQSSDTQGGLLSLGAGDQEEGMGSFRFGTQLNKDVYGRFYASRHDQGSYQNLADQSDAQDDWQMTSAGFRLDGDVGLSDNWTLQGDLYKGEEGQLIFPYWTAFNPIPATVLNQIDNEGYNLLARWQHKFSETTSWTLQAYYDVSTRDEIYIKQSYDIFDLDFQHRFQWLERNDIIWGLGYRNIADKFRNSFTVKMVPDKRTSELYSGFLQDEITLISDQLWLTLGAKLEGNDYTGTEIQPGARLLWKAKEGHSFWTSVSRAVRTPSRAEDSSQVVLQVVYFPLPTPSIQNLTVYGDPELKAEELIANEAGYRYTGDNNFSFDLSLFHNQYKNLINHTMTDFTTIMFTNYMKGTSEGLEINSLWRPLPWLSTEVSYSYLHFDMDILNPSPIKPSDDAFVIENSSPQHQASVRTGFELNKKTHLNLWARYVGTLKAPSAVAYDSGIQVDSYVALDANIVWKPVENLELMLVGQNLLDSQHQEFVDEFFTPAIEIGRSVYAKLTWKF